LFIFNNLLHIYYIIFFIKKQCEALKVENVQEFSKNVKGLTLRVRDDFTSFRHGVVGEISPMHKIFAQFLLVASW
jgi:hypothetical protein